MKNPVTAIKQTIRNLGTRFIYMIGDEGAILIYIEGGIVQRRLFAPKPDVQHTKIFIEVMNEYPNVPIYVLIDMIDQSYIRHTLPPVSQLGLSKIITRRLERDFAKDDIKGALILGRENTGRKDWNLLLISVARSKELQAWLDIVEDLSNRFIGIYLVPVECEDLLVALDNGLKGMATVSSFDDDDDVPKKKRRVKKARVAKKSKVAKEADGQSRWQILTSHNKIGGYRQVVLKDGRLVFTRITQPGEGTPELQAGNVEQEIQNTIEYLKRLSFSEDAPLDLYVIVGQEVKDNISPSRFSYARMHLMTPHEAASALGLKQAVLSGDRFGDMVIGGGFGIAKKHRLRLTTPSIDKVESLYKAKNGLRIGGAALAAMLVLFGLYNLVRLPVAISELNEIQSRATRSQERVDNVRKAMTGMKIDPDQVNDLVALQDMVDASATDPLASVSTMQGLLDDDHLFSKLEWKNDLPAGPHLVPKDANPSAVPAVVDPSITTGEGQKGPITIELAFDVRYHRPPWDVFTQETEAYFKKFEAGFKDYRFVHDSLPGETEETTNLSVNFDELDQREQSSGESQIFPINATLNGPVSKNDSSPVGAVP